MKGKIITTSPSAKMKTHRKLAYESTNSTIATVSKKGVIKAVGQGECYIYAYAQNGIHAAIEVDVE